jgi:hypothetical protein
VQNDVPKRGPGVQEEASGHLHLENPILENIKNQRWIVLTENCIQFKSE